MGLLWNRADQPPAEVVARADLEAGDKVLAACRSEESWLLGTRRAFVAVGTETVRRVPWERVDQGSWDSESSTLTLSEIQEGTLEGPVATYPIQAPGRLLELVRERVTATMLMQRRIAIAGKRGLTVSARRRPGDSSVWWSVRYDPGIDADDPAIAAVADTALAEARAELLGNA